MITEMIEKLRELKSQERMITQELTEILLNDKALCEGIKAGLVRPAFPVAPYFYRSLNNDQKPIRKL